MKFVLICLFFLSTSSVYSQSDSIYKAGENFTITYSDTLNNHITKDEVSILKLSKDSLTFKLTFIGYPWNKILTIGTSQLSKFGYRSGIGFGNSIRNGSIFGFAVGFIGFCAAIKDISIGQGLLAGLIFAVPGALIGAVTGIDSKEYEVVDVSKYDPERKYEVIKKLIQKGLNKNK